MHRTTVELDEESMNLLKKNKIRFKDAMLRGIYELSHGKADDRARMLEMEQKMTKMQSKLTFYAQKVYDLQKKEVN